MDDAKFLEWLSTERAMGARSAKDVISRCGRVSRWLHIEEFNASVTELLKESKEFQSSSTFTRSQLKRAVSLHVEFRETQQKG